MPLVIPPANPLANYLHYQDEIDAAVGRVLNSGRYILAAEVASFENEFAAYLGTSHAVSVGSGTDALYLALRASNIGSGDAVLTVSHTAVATVAAIEWCGATPVFVDIDPLSLTIDVGKLREVIKRYDGPIKAIVPVHLYGHPADLSDLMDVAGSHGLRVIEDCSQAHGALWKQQKVGAFGDCGIFSFYPTKNMGAFGDGGAVVTNDRELADRIRLLRQYGWNERSISYRAGVNSRLDELQAAILRVKLSHLDEDNRRRVDLAGLYSTMLTDHEQLRLPQRTSTATPVYHQYVIRTAARDELREYLRRRGIGTSIHYPVPVHLQPAYAGRIRIHCQLKETEDAARQVLSLPLFPELREEQLRTVVHHICAWAQRPSDV